MVTTIKPSPSLTAGRHLDPFLFAEVRREAYDTPLTVLSALARADVDPWLEAERLAKMPTRAAGERLRALISNSPGGRSILADDSDVAVDRLIALLPQGARERRSTPGANAPAIDWRIAIYITLGLMIGIQLLSRNAMKPPNAAAASPATQIELQPKVRTPLHGG